MKKYLLAVAASAVLGGGAYAADLPLKAAPIAPQPVVSGYLGLYIGGSTASHDNPDELDGSVFTFGAVGAANVWFSQG
jgi:hypothetical protein